jgi:hypothetical protein
MKYDGLKIVEGFKEISQGGAVLLEGREWIRKACWRRYFQRAWQIDMQCDNEVSWLTEPVDPTSGDVVFVWDMGLGTDDVEIQNTGKFSIFLNDKHVIDFCDTLHTRLWEREDVRFLFEAKRRETHAAFGLGYLMVPYGMTQTGMPAVIKVVSHNNDSKRWFMLCQYGEEATKGGVSFSDPNAKPVFLDEGLELLKKGRQRYKSSDGYTLCLGDLHVHSSMANYVKATPEQDLDYARYVSCIDFIAITDQDHFLNDRSFKKVIANANDHNEPGKFAAFIGYEWSSRRFGHRNVIFRGDSGKLIRRHNEEKPYEPPYPRERDDSFDVLRKGLKASGYECLLLPHHPSMTSMGPLNWDIFDEELEAAVEIYSVWGSSEYEGAPGRSLCNDQKTGSYVRDAFDRGYLLGIIGSGETTDGHPGNNQWRSEYAYKAGFALAPLGGGIACAWAKEVTREAIFDAIKARRCYGATDTGFVVEYRLNDSWMGEVITTGTQDLKSGYEVKIDARIKAEDTIEGITLFKNGKMIDHKTWCDKEIKYIFRDILRHDECFEKNGRKFCYYYIRVKRKDGHMAWSSPVWIREE